MSEIVHGKCVFKGNCELNCQFFFTDDETPSHSSTCTACNHMRSFHEVFCPAVKALKVPYGDSRAVGERDQVFRRMTLASTTLPDPK